MGILHVDRRFKRYYGCSKKEKVKRPSGVIRILVEDGHVYLAGLEMD